MIGQERELNIHRPTLSKEIWIEVIRRVFGTFEVNKFKYRLLSNEGRIYYN